MAPPKSLVLSTEALGKEFVTLLVGKEKAEYMVHKKLLCDRSAYFSGAFSTGFAEAQNNIIRLPEDTIVAVTTLIDFIYRGAIPEMPSQVDNSTSLETLDYAKCMLEAYILGEKICYDEFMNKLLDSIVAWKESLRCQIWIAHGQYVYSNTHQESRLRRYLALVGAASLEKNRRFGEAWMNNEMAQGQAHCFGDTVRLLDCPELYLDIFKMTIAHSKKLEQWSKDDDVGELPISAIVSDRCYFHVHTAEKVRDEVDMVRVEFGVYVSVERRT